MPDGISCVSPGFNSSGASRQARRSTPAEPEVAYCGKGKSRPMRASSTRTCKRRRAPPIVVPSAMSSGNRWGWICVCDFATHAITLGDQLYQLSRQRGFAGERQLLLAALPVHGERVVVFVEGQAVADFVGGDHVEVLVGELGKRVALHVLGLSSKSHQERRPGLAARDSRQNIGRAS